ncbi:MAG: hypothetical protein LBL95_08070 [Deltaproteobacteria bacterium]|jgi:hypothetical protein|nr:hypothetical protein [Deltaproteobacteria bacterium]
MSKEFFPEVMDVPSVDTLARTLANWVDVETFTRILREMPPGFIRLPQDRR